MEKLLGAGVLEREGPDSRPSSQPAIVLGASVGQPPSVVLRPAGYRMIENFEARNFRCFESLQLNGLKRVNIITGENASGKSALLEALFAAARGNAEALILMNQFRGVTIGSSIAGFPMVATAVQFPAIWDHWFYSSKKASGSVEAETQRSVTATKISLRYSDSDNVRYACDFTHEAVPQPLSSQAAPFVTNRNKTEEGKEPSQSASNMILGPQGQLQSFPPLPNLGPAAFIFTANLNYAEQDNVMWFSQMRETGETQEIIGFFKKNFPFIEHMEVLQPNPGAPAGIYATLTSGSIRRLPAVSSGIHKITSILLACARARKGIVLIDEIENGIFYDKYGLTWYILNKFSKDYDCQIFVTSHSLECLQKLVPIIGDDVDSFSLLQAARENGICTVRHTSGTAMKAALLGGNDVRGGNGKWGSPQ